jgi:hypothetical protein
MKGERIRWTRGETASRRRRAARDYSPAATMRGERRHVESSTTRKRSVGSKCTATFHIRRRRPAQCIGCRYTARRLGLPRQHYSSHHSGVLVHDSHSSQTTGCVPATNALPRFLGCRFTQPIVYDEGVWQYISHTPISSSTSLCS